MDYGQHVDAVERDTKALVDALRVGPLDVGVPSCPEWTLIDLADHVGGFTGFWSHVLCEGRGVANTPFREMPPGLGVA
ncbi:MAG TPA: maleylpyruvate isomerase N-terminal domain-containing protein, partial [Acidimicrobiales bacterium]|nr:maleylpyruvate isomerase N-terminal domain-containing protein [Acidimicrobiales bacterium]